MQGFKPLTRLARAVVSQIKGWNGTVFAGLAFTPFVAAAALVLGMPGEFDAGPWALPIIVGVYPFALTVELMFGLPLLILGQRVGAVRWWSATASGVVVGAVALTLLIANPLIPHQAGYALNARVPAAAGGLSGFALWIFWWASGVDRGTKVQDGKPASAEQLLKRRRRRLGMGVFSLLALLLFYVFVYPHVIVEIFGRQVPKEWAMRYSSTKLGTIYGRLGRTNYGTLDEERYWINEHWWGYQELDILCANCDDLTSLPTDVDYEVYVYPLKFPYGILTPELRQPLLKAPGG